MSPIRMARNIVIKNCAIRKEGARRRRGGAGLLSGPVGIVLLDWCRKIYKSDLSLIFFCILDEAATDYGASKVKKTVCSSMRIDY